MVRPLFEDNPLILRNALLRVPNQPRTIGVKFGQKF